MKGYLTQTEIVNLNLSLGATMINSSRLNDLIDSYKRSNNYLMAITGDKYYKGEHDILQKRRYYYVDNRQVEDRTKANNRIVHNFFETLILQKASYIAGNPVKIKYNGQNDKIILDRISKVLGDKFDFMIVKAIIDASTKGITYLHPYIDEKGNFKITIIPATEVIPIYDTDYEETLTEVIRFYPIEYIMESTLPYQRQSRYKLEWWTADEVYYYIQLENGTFVLDNSMPENPAPHFRRYNTATSSTNNLSWGQVPFVPILNNDNKTSDLTVDLKSLIDAYNKVKSGWCDDIDDFQELIYVLKGYVGLGGDRNTSRLANFIHNLKFNKAIAVDEQGGVETLKSEIPVDAKERFLKLTREEIFYLGKGIDIMSEKLGGNQSGVSLKFIYSLLDLKANVMIRNLNYALNDLMYFVSLYLQLTQRITIDTNNIYFVFNKSMIFNESEKVQNCVVSKGIISDKTIIENHPYVDDPDVEMQRLEEQNNNELQSSLKLFQKTDLNG